MRIHVLSLGIYMKSLSPPVNLGIPEITTNARLDDGGSEDSIWPLDEKRSFYSYNGFPFTNAL
jgi:hypothetical protein